MGEENNTSDDTLVSDMILSDDTLVSNERNIRKCGPLLIQKGFYKWN